MTSRTRLHRLGPLLSFVVAVVLGACSEATSPTATETGEELAGFELAVPRAVNAGQPFPLTVTAIGSEGSRPFGGFSGVVALSSSVGSLTPASVALSGGEVALDVVVSGAAGPATITASHEGLRGEALIETIALGALPGDPDDSAPAAVPTAPFRPRAEEYAEDHPDLSGVGLSVRTIVALLARDATVGGVNEALEALEAPIIGGIKGVNGIGAIVFLELPTDTHEAAAAAVDALTTTSAFEAAVVDVLLAGGATPPSGGTTPPDWSWDALPAGGNWGLELVRAPQMWNLNGAITKMGRTTPTGVLDAGFDADHPDLSYAENLTPSVESGHGTHVAGIIGAEWNNGTGVDGINPFADLVVMGPDFGTPGLNLLAQRTSWGEQMLSGYHELVSARPDLAVVNASLGYNWSQSSIDPNTNAAARSIASTQGFIFSQVLAALEAQQDVPLLVASAGNDAEATLQDAAFSSPMTNARLEHGVSSILVVESDSLTSSGAVVRSSFSNIDGEISAPGSLILSAYMDANGTATYGRLSGTSMAAPLVTGLAGYLLAIEPNLTHAQIRSLLSANSVPVAGGASNRVDAFASALDIDRITGGSGVLRMMLDIDDGTVDGNQRMSGSAPYTEEDADGDRGIGDGQVDMSDFRRYRDWVLQLYAQGAGLALDGDSLHVKKDVNGNGVVEGVVGESKYPRGDFNGDGSLDPFAERYVPGAVADSVTDLEVLQSVFSDPDYGAAELPLLVFSGDVVVDPTRLLQVPGSDSVVVRYIRSASGDTVQVRSHVPGDSANVVTLAAPEAYLLRATVYGSRGDEIGFAEVSDTLRLGGDWHWAPELLGQLLPTITVPSAAQPGELFPVTVRVGSQAPGDTVVFRAGIPVTLTATGGTLGTATGTTDGEGYVYTEGALDPTTSTMAIFATASSPGFSTATAVANVSVDQGVTVTAEPGGWVSVTVRAGLCSDMQTRFDGSEVSGTGTFTAQQNHSYLGSSASGTISATVTAGGGAELYAVQGSVNLSGSQGPGSACGNGGQAGGFFGARFTVEGGPVEYRLTSTLSEEGATGAPVFTLTQVTGTTPGVVRQLDLRSVDTATDTLPTGTYDVYWANFYTESRESSGSQTLTARFSITRASQ